MLFTVACFSIFTSYSQVRNGVTYDFSCIEDDLTSTAISTMSDLENAALGFFDTPVSIEEEIEVGNNVLEQTRSEYSFIESGKELTHLKAILKKLTAKIDNPVGFTYQIYLLDTDLLNAFTAGGKIFFTTEMYRFCRTEDELACIIGHEICHNELGHIRNHVKKAKTANAIFGDGIGNIATFYGNLLSTPFNQKNETHCDFAGIDLAIAAGYDACQSSGLWERMNENQAEYSQMNSIFSSHPYSGKRAVCNKIHIQNNYNFTCE